MMKKALLILIALMAGVLQSYRIELLQGGVWTPVSAKEEGAGRVHIVRFEPVKADAVRVRFLGWNGELAIAEVGVYKQ